MVAYDGGEVRIEFEDAAWIDPLGDWQRSTGRMITVDDRLVDQGRPGVGPGGLPGPAAYTYEREAVLQGSLFVHSMHLLQGGSTQVAVDGVERWSVETTVPPGSSSTIAKAHTLRLPPGSWTLAVDVNRTDGYHSTVLVELPEGPSLPFKQTTIYDERRSEGVDLVSPEP